MRAARHATVTVLLALLAGAVCWAAHPSTAWAFDDVDPASPYARAIDELAAAGVVEGFDAQRFGPNERATRQQFAKMIVLAVGEVATEGDTCSFADVEVSGPDSLYPDNFIAVAAARGFTQGVDTARFAPDRDITRAQLVTMAMRAGAARFPTLSGLPPAHYSTLGSFSRDHADWMDRAEYQMLLAGVVGFGPQWDPWLPATRADMAMVLWRLRSLGTRADTAFSPADVVADYLDNHRYDTPYTREELQAFLGDQPAKDSVEPHALRLALDQVKPHPRIRRIVYDGDSLTAGSGATQPYPTQLMRTWPHAVSWKNTAVGGQSVPDILRYAPERVDTFFRADAERNVVVAWAGTNDIALWDHESWLIFDQFVQYANERRRQGFTVVVMTALPRADQFARWDFDARRLELNRLIRENWESFADLLIDIALDPRLGNAGAERNQTYFTPDLVHMNNNGYGTVASIVKARLLQLDDWTADLR